MRETARPSLRCWRDKRKAGRRLQVRAPPAPARGGYFDPRSRRTCEIPGGRRTLETRARVTRAARPARDQTDGAGSFRLRKTVKAHAASEKPLKARKLD